MFDRVRGAAAALTLAILFGASSAPSDSLGASSTVTQTSTPQVLKTSGEPFDIAVDAQTGRAYVTDLKADTLFVFDLNGGAALAYIPTGRQPNHVVLSGARAFVSNFADASVTVIDTSTNREVKTLAVGGLGLAINRQTSRLYAAAGSRLSVVDTTSDTVVATLSAPGANLWGVAVDPAANRIYVTDIATPRVLVYDGAINKLVGEVVIDAPARFAIAVGPAGRVFVASYTDQSPQLSVIDGVTLKVVARSPLAAYTTSLLADDPGGVVYGSSGVDRSVTAVNTTLGGAPSKTGLTDVPGGLARNPMTNALIVATPGGAAPPARPLNRAPVTKP